MSKLVYLDENNFDRKIKNDNDNIIVGFLADWCGPSKMLTTILSEISKEENKSIYVLDADSNLEFLKKMNIEEIPSIHIYKNSKLVRKMKKVFVKEEIKEILSRLG